MTSSPVHIKLLGPVEISYRNQPVQITRRIERAILYFLAVEHRPITRTVLIDLFWSNKETVDQRSALRTTLSRLRKHLPDPNLMITDLDQVWLDAKHYQVDVLDFEYQFLNVRHTLSTYQEKLALPQQIVQQIQDVLNLWHGDDFIGGDVLTSHQDFENWRQGWQWKLAYYRRFLMKRLAEHYRAAGQLEYALGLYLKLSSMDLLNTDLHITALDLMIRLGQHQAVIEYCDMLENIYEKEYNAPLPEAILAKCQYAQIQKNPSVEQNQKKWPSALTMQLELVGREAELDALQNSFRMGGLVTISGELGSGKTRLVQELFKTLEPTPSLFVAPALDMENALPLSPIIYALRNHIPDDIWCDIDPVWAQQLSLLLPELVNIRTDIKHAQLAHHESGNQYLFDAILHLMRLTARRFGRILFFLDNAHWVDKQTVQLLSYIVAHHFFKEYGLLIIAFRPEETNPDLDILLGHLHRDYPVQQITLTGLNPNETALLVQRVTETHPSPGLVDQLVQETRGNPLLSLEIVRTIQELPENLGEFPTDSGLPLPESIHAIYRKRLSRLDEVSRHTLLCAAVLGNSFSLDVLEKLSQLNLITESGTLDQLIQAGMLQSKFGDRHGHPTLQFTHEKLREVVLKETTPIRLQLIHRQVADHLASEPGVETKAAVIAQHYLASEDVYNAFYWFLKAARHAWMLGATEDAISAFQQAENLTQMTPADSFSIDDLFELYKQWSEFAYQANQRDMMEKIALKLQYIGERHKNSLLLGISQMTLANVCFLRLNFELSLEFIERAITNLENTNERRTYIHAILRQGNYYWWINKFDQVIECTSKAQSIIKNLGEEAIPEKEALIFYARHMTGMAYYGRGEAARTLEFAQLIQSYDIPRLKRFNQIRAYIMLSHAYLLSGQYSDSERYVLNGMELTRDLKNEFIYEIFLILYSKLRFIKGDLDTAYATATEAQTLGQKNGSIHTVVNANSLLGDIYKALNDPVRSFQFYRMAQIRSGYLQSSPQRLQNEIHLAYLLVDLGQLAEAREILENVIETAQTYEMRQLHAFALCVLGVCDTIEYDFSLSARNVDQACAIAKENHLIYELTMGKLGQASLNLAQKRYAAAEQLLKEFLTESKQIGHVWLQINGFRLMSQLYQIQNIEMPLEYQSLLEALINQIQEHTQSEPLKDLFLSARQSWESRKLTP